MLARHGIDCSGKTARQVTRQDYDRYDHLIAMDQSNLRNLRPFVGADPQTQGIPCCWTTPTTLGSVADPWYTGDFEATWRDVLTAAPVCWTACGKRGRSCKFPLHFPLKWTML